MIILPTSYFPNIEYLYQLLKHKEIVISTNELFPKQTLRNRCVILNANGLQNLSIPVEREQGHETLTRDIRISYAEDWVKNHRRSIESAYRRTPFYEYYIDGIEQIFSKRPEYLIDLNQSIMAFLVDKIGLSCTLSLDDSAEKIPRELNDMLNPKMVSEFRVKPYLQTFTERYGFQNNLSTLDLLFHEGPNAICILMESGSPM